MNVGSVAFLPSIMHIGPPPPSPRAKIHNTCLFLENSSCNKGMNTGPMLSFPLESLSRACIHNICLMLIYLPIKETVSHAFQLQFFH
jgi:hypothetical protein